MRATSLRFDRLSEQSKDCADCLAQIVHRSNVVMLEKEIDFEVPVQRSPLCTCWQPFQFDESNFNSSIWQQLIDSKCRELAKFQGRSIDGGQGAPLGRPS